MAYETINMLNMTDPANVILMKDELALQVLEAMDTSGELNIKYDDPNLGTIVLSESTLNNELDNIDVLEEQAVADTESRYCLYESPVCDSVEDEVDDYFESDSLIYEDYGDFIDFLMDQDAEE